MTGEVFHILAITEAEQVSGALFYLFALMSAAAAVAIVISRSIVRMAVYLLFALVGVAGLYFLMLAEFLAAVQVVIYAGGTLILLLFGVMLTSKSPFSRLEPKLAEVVIAICIAAVLLISLVMGIHYAAFPMQAFEPAYYPVPELGAALMGDYLVPFEFVAVMLLVVMIGAAYVAKARRRDESAEPRSERRPPDE